MPKYPIITVVQHVVVGKVYEDAKGTKHPVKVAYELVGDAIANMDPVPGSDQSAEFEFDFNGMKFAASFWEDKERLPRNVAEPIDY